MTQVYLSFLLYSSPVFKGRFDNNSLQLFRSLQKSNSGFDEHSLQNVRIAAELSSIANRYPPRQNHGEYKGRGHRRGDRDMFQPFRGTDFPRFRGRQQNRDRDQEDSYSPDYFDFIIFIDMYNEEQFHSNLENWKSLGASNTVLSWIEHDVKFPRNGDISSFELPNGNLSAKQETFLNSEINNLLLLGCIERVTSRLKCVSPISCLPKKNGKFRLVTDLRHINTHSQPPKVKNEDINTVISVVKPKDYIVTTGLQNGFFPRACKQRSSDTSRI